jgi:hypothetical protein
MKIYIQIDGVLRNDLDKIAKVYSKYYLDNESFKLNDYNLEKNLIFKNKDINVIEFNPENTGYLDEMISDVLDITENVDSFLDENALEIYGYADESENNVINFLNDLDKKLKNKIILFSLADGKKIPSTLFFLSKYSCMLKNYLFINNFKDLKKIIKKDDILVFDYINGVDEIKSNTKIKIKKEYNSFLKSDMEITELKKINECIVL